MYDELSKLEKRGTEEVTLVFTRVLSSTNTTELDFVDTVKAYLEVSFEFNFDLDIPAVDQIGRAIFEVLARRHEFGVECKEPEAGDRIYATSHSYVYELGENEETVAYLGNLDFIFEQRELN